MNYIFLDIDGVLNANCDFGGRSKPNPYVTTDSGELYCGICTTHLRHLKSIVDKTDAKIVLVSSWKQDYVDYIKHGYQNRVGKYLYNKLKKFNLEIFDTTIKYNMDNGMSRGYEIITWLNNHPEVDSWVVLDDVEFDDYCFMGILPHLVKLDENYGLWSIPAVEAICKLTGRDASILTNYYKNPLKYISEALPEQVEKIFDNLLVVHSLEVK